MIQVLFMLITEAFVTVIFFGYHWVGFPGYTLKIGNYKWALLVSFIADLVGSAFNEAIYSQQGWRRTQLEKGQLVLRLSDKQTMTLLYTWPPTALFPRSYNNWYNI